MSGPDARVAIYPVAEVERLRNQARWSRRGWAAAAILFVSTAWLLGGYLAFRSREDRLDTALTRMDIVQARLETLTNDYVKAREQQAEVAKLMITLGELQAAKEELVRYNRTHKSIPVADAWKPQKPIQ